MADLKALFGKKKETTSDQARAEEPQVESHAKAAPVESQPQAGNAATKPAFGGFKVGKPASGPTTDSVRAVEPAAATPLTLDDLDSTTDEGVAPRASTPSGFHDETPATAPVRELPADLEPTQKQFVDLIDGVYQIIHEPDVLGNVIKSIMLELKANPQYIKLIAPEDVRTWIRAMRDSMGLAKINKAEKKARASGGSKRSARVDDDMLADLASLGLDMS